MSRVTTNIIHAFLVKMPSMAVMFMFLGHAQSTMDEASIVNTFITLQTFAFIVTQPGYLIILREGLVNYQSQIIWFSICSVVMILCTSFYGNQSLQSYALAYGFLFMMKSSFIAGGLRKNPTQLIFLEMGGLALNISILYILWLSPSNSWTSLGVVMIIILVVEIFVLMIPLTGEVMKNAKRSDGLQLKKSVLNGVIVLTAAAYSMIIILDVSEEVSNVAGALAAAFSVTYIARGLLGTVSSGFNTYFISSQESRSQFNIVTIAAGLFSSWIIIIIISYATIIIGIVSIEPALKQLVTISIFLSCTFVSSMVNAELFKKSPYWSAFSGAFILVLYFSLKFILNGMILIHLWAISPILIATPVMLLHRLRH